MLSNGLFSTGMRGVMLGSISPRWLTRSIKPLMSSPKVVISCILWVVRIETIIMSHASRSIVSYPFAIGIVPLIIHLKAKVNVSMSHDKPMRQVKILYLFFLFKNKMDKSPNVRLAMNRIVANEQEL